MMDAAEEVRVLAPRLLHLHLLGFLMFPVVVCAYPPQLVGYNPAGHIRFSTAAEAEAKRQQVIDYIWEGGLPTTTPMVTAGVAFPAEFNLNTGVKAPVNSTLVSSVDRLDFEVNSQGYRQSTIGYLLHPQNASSTPKLAIFNTGHQSDLGLDTGNAATVNALLASGFHVVQLDMPVSGRNNTAEGRTFTLPNNQTVMLRNATAGHNDLFDVYAASHDGGRFSYFLEPVVQSINQFTSQYPNTEQIVMVGKSGGGYTTAFAAAVDTRIDVSIPVAGSLPLYARPFSPSHSDDDEQRYVPMFGEVDLNSDGVADAVNPNSVASWMEIYALGALGEGRHQVQVNTFQDPCCFGGDAYKSYDYFVSQVVNNIGPGDWEYHLDTSHAEHLISSDVLHNVILPAVNQPNPLGLRLEVNAATGSAVLYNPTNEAIQLDGYQLQTPSWKPMNVAGWQSLQESGSPGWDEANESQAHLGELNLFGYRAIAPGERVSLGKPFVPPTRFGVTPAPIPVEFRYSQANGQVSEGEVVGLAGANNLVLEADLTTGQVTITNSSVFDIHIVSYQISSASGALAPMNWTSLNSEGQAGWMVDSSSNLAVGEHASSGALLLRQLGVGETLSLGALLQPTSNGDLSDLAFTFQVVQGVSGDYNGNGIVDLADYTIWRDNLGGTAGAIPNNPHAGIIGNANYLTWKNSFGNKVLSAGTNFTGVVRYVSSTPLSMSTPVPETNSLYHVLGMLGLGVIMCLRNRLARSNSTVHGNSAAKASTN